MVEFLFTEDNNSVDSEEQSSEYFYDVSTSNMLNYINLHVLFLLSWNIILWHFISSFLFTNALFQYCLRLWFSKFTTVH